MGEHSNCLFSYKTVQSIDHNKQMLEAIFISARIAILEPRKLQADIPGLLPNLGKLLEKISYKLLLQHLQPLADFQWGFQAGKFTAPMLAARNYTHFNWLNLREKGKDVAAVFFDFKESTGFSPPQRVHKETKKAASK